MFSKFYFKYVLFVAILFLLALIITAQNNKVLINVRVDDVDAVDVKGDISNNLMVYVANEDDLIFPLNVNVSRDLSYRLNGYEGKIASQDDMKLYYTFSLLTNSSNYLPLGVDPLIPKSTKILSYELTSDHLTLNVSEDFLRYSKEKEEKVMSILVYTFSQLVDVTYVRILANNQPVEFHNLDGQWFTKNDFVLNSYVASTVSHHNDYYELYYYIPVGEALYLVPYSIIDTYTENKQDKLDYYLKHTASLPVITLIDDESEYAMIQYELTMEVNGIEQGDDASKLKEINYYEVKFR